MSLKSLLASLALGSCALLPAAAPSFAAAPATPAPVQQAKPVAVQQAQPVQTPAPAATAAPAAPPVKSGPVQEAQAVSIPPAQPVGSTAAPAAPAPKQPLPQAQPVQTRPPAPTKPPAPTPPPTKPPAPTLPPTPVPTAAPRTTVQGVVFVDANGDGEMQGDEKGTGQVQVTLAGPAGFSKQTTTSPSGDYAFEGVPLGAYHLAVKLPDGYQAGKVAGRDVLLDRDITLKTTQPTLVDVALVKLPSETATPADATPTLDGDTLADATPSPTDDAATLPNGVLDDTAALIAAAANDQPDDQIAALRALTSLPLRFAEGRDLLAQVQKRALPSGVEWLGVPFRSQLDGGSFQLVNCGPASLTMVLASFGLNVGPSEIRDYLNGLIGNFDTDTGTSLDVLSQIARQAGLKPLDLYGDSGYRNWSVDAVRWHIQQGHPVITLVKYQRLPGHTQSLSNTDHYVVITGVTPGGFIYNDAAYITNVGYGLEISDAELEQAWENSSIPHHAVAFTLPDNGGPLSFPEQPRKQEALEPEPPQAAPTEMYERTSDAASIPTMPPLAAAAESTLAATDAQAQSSPNESLAQASADVPESPSPAEIQHQFVVESGSASSAPGAATGLALEPDPTSGPGRGGNVQFLLAQVLAILFGCWLLCSLRSAWRAALWLRPYLGRIHVPRQALVGAATLLRGLF